jgi:hypothetical protein
MMLCCLAEKESAGAFVIEQKASRELNLQGISAALYFVVVETENVMKFTNNFVKGTSKNSHFNCYCFA